MSGERPGLEIRNPGLHSWYQESLTDDDCTLEGHLRTAEK